MYTGTLRNVILNEWAREAKKDDTWEDTIGRWGANVDSTLHHTPLGWVIHPIDKFARTDYAKKNFPKFHKSMVNPDGSRTLTNDVIGSFSPNPIAFASSLGLNRLMSMSNKYQDKKKKK